MLIENRERLKSSTAAVLWGLIEVSFTIKVKLGTTKVCTGEFNG